MTNHSVSYIPILPSLRQLRERMSNSYTLQPSTLTTLVTHGKLELEAELKDYKETLRRGDTPPPPITVSFPDRMGMVSYVLHEETDDSMYIYFRHDECEAQAFDGDGDYYDDYYQPPVYFCVNVNKISGLRVYNLLYSSFAIDGRVIPHSGSNGGAHFAVGHCDGHYSNGLYDAIALSDLSLFLMKFSDYIRTGTNAKDEYGYSYEEFTSNASINSRGVSIDREDQLRMAKIIYEDDTPPFNMARREGTGGRISASSRELLTKFIMLFSEEKEGKDD